MPRTRRGTELVCEVCGQPFLGYRSSRVCGHECYKASRRAAYAASPERQQLARADARERMYRRWGSNFSEAQYSRVLARQGGRCAICQQPPRVGRLAPDHNHRTGAFRALLCIRCNTGIGKFDDDPARLEAAAEYVREHGRSRD